MRYLFYIIVIFPLSLWAETLTTGNLLTNGTFENGNANGWTQNGNGTVISDCCGSSYDYEFGNNGSIEQSFNLTSDDITQQMLNNGITLNSNIQVQNGECAVAGCWGGQGGADSFTIRLRILDSDSAVLSTTTQTRTDTTGINGEYFTNSVSYTGIGSNIGDIKISGTDANAPATLGGANVDNISVTMTYDDTVLTATQTAELNTTFQEIEELIEIAEEVLPETIEELFLEEIVFEVFEQPEITFEMFEELIIEEIAEEEINTGIVNIFFETFETSEVIEISELPSIESFEEIPMEEFYEETTPTISEPIEYAEEISEETEVGQTIEETSNSSGESVALAGREEEATGSEREEIGGTGNGNTPAENERGTSNELGENSQEEESSGNSAGEQEEEITVAESETTESESNDERGSTTEQSQESNTSEESTDRDGETETTEQDIETDNQSSQPTVADISVEKIRQKVESVIKEVDKQLVVTNIIVAKSMQSGLDINSYSQVNNNIFDNQPTINGGEYSDILEYTDNRNIYQQSQVMYNDDYSKYQKDIDDAKANTIRAKEHLRRIRGY